MVETVDQVRTRGKARERLIELIVERPIERLAILHTISPDVEAFRDEVLARAPGLDPADVTIDLVGASVGPHLGPGCVGAAILYRLPDTGPATLRQGCDSVADRYHRGGANRRVAAILGPKCKSRADHGTGSPEPGRRAPWGRPGDDPDRGGR